MRRRGRARRAGSATFSSEPALPITRCPRIFAICATRLPTAPAAAETQTTSPSRRPATWNRPAYAVSPLPPSTPRYACGGATEVSSFVSVPTPARAPAPGLDDRVVAPAGRVPDGVARRESVGAGLDDLADGQDPVHRRLERERGEVARRPLRAQPQPERRRRPRSTCCARAPRPRPARPPRPRRCGSRTAEPRRADTRPAEPRARSCAQRAGAPRARCGRCSLVEVDADARACRCRCGVMPEVDDLAAAAPRSTPPGRRSRTGRSARPRPPRADRTRSRRARRPRARRRRRAATR